MNTETTPTRKTWTPSQGESAIFLLLLVVIVSDMPEPIPFWQTDWGQAPSVGTVLLISGLILAIARFGRRSGVLTDAAR